MREAFFKLNIRGELVRLFLSRREEVREDLVDVLLWVGMYLANRRVRECSWCSLRWKLADVCLVHEVEGSTAFGRDFRSVNGAAKWSGSIKSHGTYWAVILSERFRSRYVAE
jgi:hypothetical protein